MRRLKILFAGLIGLLVLTYAGFWLTAPTAVDMRPYGVLEDRYDGRIVRDDFGVPHIYGARDIDVVFGLAYAHAEDDFDTIEDVLLAARGQVAAKHGASAAVTDYLVQWMGTAQVSTGAYPAGLSAEARAVADAYADGLNFWASQNPGRAHGLTFPVRGQDVIAGMAFKLPLFYGLDKVLPQVLDGTYGGSDKGTTTTSALTYGLPQPVVRGSQGIAVAPSRSADESTRLLINSHQPLEGPVAWYEARLKSEEGLDMVGGLFPGSPLILHGHGPTLGWASTVNKPDLVDVFALTLNPENKDEYQLDGAFVPFETQAAVITVKLWGALRWRVTRPIERSAFGPVLRTDDGRAFAVRFAGMGDLRTLDFFLALNKARTKDDFEAALRQQSMPSINYVLATRRGEIAHYYNALIPKRLEGVDWSGLINRDDSALAWTEYHPFEALPKTVNPPSGYVYNANNTPYRSTSGSGAPRAADFPANMGVETQMTNRAYRIERLFGADAEITADAFAQYKFDAGYDAAFPPFKALKAAVQTLPDSEAKDLLAGWDGSTGETEKGAALGTLALYPHVTAPLTGEPAPTMRESIERAKAYLLEHFSALDVPWGEVNRLVRGSESWPLSGGPDILRAVYADWEDDGRLRAVAGDTYILIVAWAADGTLLSSQSIHNYGSATLDAASPHYADQAPLFAAEQLRPVRWTEKDLMAHKTSEYRY